MSTDLPSLDEVARKRVSTVKHVPARARDFWARCLVRALAAAVFYNSVEAWTELEMLPKCVLCTPPRGGRAHANRAAAFCEDRLSRWLAGERGTLWEDLSAPGDRKKGSATKKQRHTRALALAREGFDRKACAALCSEPPVDPSAAVRDALLDLHPRKPPMEHQSPRELPAPPSFATDAVEAALRSFPRDSAAGPTGLRAQHLLEALTPGHATVVL